MKILYGVQGTGNGHLTRARALARAFRAHPGVEVDWLVSGRAREALFDMECFGDYRWRRGLSFVTRGGSVSYLRTALAAAPAEFVRDVRALALGGYDAVITDFEPVTAWAARLRGVECIGMGHQYALGPGVPRAAWNPVGQAVLGAFAPVSVRLGLHWHHFGRAILPPIVDVDVHAHHAADDREVLVYLPFEDTARVLAMLRGFGDWRFSLFAPGLRDGSEGNVRTRAPGRASFVAALAGSSRVVCNCGFELISEALALGKQVLCKPLQSQVEQLSNALALEQLGYARVVRRLDGAALSAFLAGEAQAPRVRYPDVAAAIASWVVRRTESPQALAARLWSDSLPASPAPAAGLATAQTG